MKLSSGLKGHLLEGAISQNNAHIGGGVKGIENNSMMVAGKQGVIGGSAINPRVHESAGQMHQETLNVTPKNIVVSNLDGPNTGKKKEILKKD